MRVEELDLKSDDELAAWVKSLVANKTEESIWLDYKRGEALDLSTREAKKELAKDISAFANTGGGAVVYGVPEVEAEGATAPDTEYGMSPIPNVEERIGSILADAVSPPLPSVRARKVRAPNGRVVYVLYHPESWEAPHLVSAYGERRYYKRISDKQSAAAAMEERDIAELYERRIRATSPSLALMRRYRPPGHCLDSGSYHLLAGVCPLYVRNRVLRFEEEAVRHWFHQNQADWPTRNTVAYWTPFAGGVRQVGEGWCVEVLDTGAIFYSVDYRWLGTSKPDDPTRKRRDSLNARAVILIWESLLSFGGLAYARFGLVGPTRLCLRISGAQNVQLVLPGLWAAGQEAHRLMETGVFVEETLPAHDVWSNGNVAICRMTSRLLMVFGEWENPYFDQQGRRKDVR